MRHNMAAWLAVVIENNATGSSSAATNILFRIARTTPSIVKLISRSVNAGAARKSVRSRRVELLQYYYHQNLKMP